MPQLPRFIRTANIDPNKQLYVATQQTMGVCYEQVSPGFFDLIVSDEAHRSIRFTEVLEYFDARMVGLTATPAAFIDRDTFRVFDCTDQTPTFLYTYEQAIKERFQARSLTREAKTLRRVMRAKVREIKTLVQTREV